MIKVVVKGNGDEVKSRTKIRCSGDRRLIAEAVTAVVSVCAIARKNSDAVTPEMIIDAAKQVIENRENAILKEE